MYDLAIIGAGAAGLEAAKTALENGLKTVIVEKDYKSWGGICLNKGCIPFKFSLHLAQKTKDFSYISREKDYVVEKIKKTSWESFRKKGLEIRWGEAVFVDEKTIDVEGSKIQAKYVIIACGSYPRKIDIKGENIFFAEEAFSSLQKDDVNILIIGGGSIGLELASFLNCLNKKVTIIEKEDSILPFLDKDISQRLKVILTRGGIRIDVSAKMENYDLSSFDKIFICVGRMPATQGLNLEGVGIELASSRIKINSYLQTNIGNIYACGDVCAKKLYAYLAQYQAQLAVKNILGAKLKPDYRGIPEAVFSLPQVAWVGLKEEEAKEKEIKYEKIISHFSPFSSSYVYQDNEGFIKVWIDKKDRIIGASIISCNASELISIFSLAIKEEIKRKNIGDLVLIHPTISEIIPSLMKIF